jgi:hypothetical protein
MRCILDDVIVDVPLLRKQRESLLAITANAMIYNLNDRALEILDGITNLLDYILAELEGFHGNPGFINKVK